MEIIFDPAKNGKNIAEHGISLERAKDFDFDNAIVIVDDRKEYGELRYRAFGALDGPLHVLVFTYRGQQMRVISLRRANKREVKWYGA